MTTHVRRVSGGEVQKWTAFRGKEACMQGNSFAFDLEELISLEE
jgi:hypothetical protein